MVVLRCLEHNIARGPSFGCKHGRRDVRNVDVRFGRHEIATRNGQGAFFTHPKFVLCLLLETRCGADALCAVFDLTSVRNIPDIKVWAFGVLKLIHYKGLTNGFTITLAHFPLNGHGCRRGIICNHRLIEQREITDSISARVV